MDLEDDYVYESTEFHTKERSNSLQYPVLPSLRKSSEQSSVLSTPTLGNALELHQLIDEQHRKAYLEQRSSVLHLLDEAQSIARDLIEIDSSITKVQFPFDQEDEQPSETCTTPVQSLFKVLRVDLRSPGRRFSSDLLNAMNDSSRSHLLIHRLNDSVKHMDRIRSRVLDTFSKVLVTGDLNAGKSTFINSLLRRDILPSDQQPCTQMFCEVMSARANHGEEAVHGIVEPELYDVDNLKTFSKFDLDHIKSALTEETSQYRLWKLYCDDNHGEEQGKSLLNNGLVDLVLIDSPGLNRDFTQTMAVFSQHEEIDAVIFVVNSENHFTLSGVEFLGEAQKEKPHIFIVVNRFDVIADKERCQENIIRQIKDLLPETAKCASELVHFVSAREFIRQELQNGHSESKSPSADQQNYKEAFDNLELCLRSFLLEKRTKTKLFPAKTYISNLIHDISLIVDYNSTTLNNEYSETTRELKSRVPEFHGIVQFSETFAARLEKTYADSSQLVQLNSQQLVDKFVENMSEMSVEVPYNGVLSLWNFADAIVRHANAKLMMELEKHEYEVHHQTQTAISNLYQMGAESVEQWTSQVGPLDKYLPAQSLAVPTIIDIRDQQLVRVQIELTDFVDISMADLRNVGFMLGAVGAVSGGLVGFKRISTAVWYVGSILGGGSEDHGVLTKVAWASVSIVGISAAVYILSDAPQTVQRKLNKKLRKQIRRSEKLHRRLNKSSYGARKTMEHCSFEFKRNMTRLLEQKQTECEQLEHKKSSLVKSRDYFHGMQGRTRGLLDALADLNIEDPSTSDSTAKRTNGIIIDRLAAK